MALPISKTIDQLKALNDDQLFDYFVKHSRFNSQSPKNACYSIAVGIRTHALFSGDTGDLREKFFKAVRS